MTGDVLHAVLHRTWLLECGLCGDQVRLTWPTAADAGTWQTLINDWEDEHADPHVCIDTVPSTSAGPLAALPSPDLLRRCQT
jgi:hypothetical protein